MVQTSLNIIIMRPPAQTRVEARNRGLKRPRHPCPLDEHIQQRLTNPMTNDTSAPYKRSAWDRVGRTHLDLPPLVLERHHQHPGNVRVERATSSGTVVIQPHPPCVNTVAERKDASEGGPFFVLVQNFVVALSSQHCVNMPSKRKRGRRGERTYVAMLGSSTRGSIPRYGTTPCYQRTSTHVQSLRLTSDTSVKCLGSVLGLPNAMLISMSRNLC